MTHWQRLSPWGVFFFLVIQLGAWARAVPAVFAAGVYGGGANWSRVTLAVLILAPLAMMGSALVSWWRFFYLVKPGRLEIRQGLLFTKHLEIPAQRVQNIEISQPFYYRPLGLYNLTIETAGASGQEAKLAALTEQQADAIKATLLGEAPAQAPSLDTPPLLTRSTGDLLIYGFCHNHLTWLLVLLAPFYDNLGKWLGNLLSAEELHLGWRLYLLGFVMLALILTVLSMAAAWLIYAPYRLEQQDQRLVQSGGIITHRQLAMKRRRLQWLVASQSLLDRIFGRWVLTFYPVKDGKAGKDPGKSQKLLAPALRPGELAPLLALGGAKALPQAPYSRPSPFYLRRLLVWSTLPLLAATLSLWHQFGALAGLLWPLAWAAITMHWLGCGWQVNGNRLWVRRGLVNVRQYLLKPAKVQRVTLSQSPGQRRRHLASLSISTGAGNLNLPWLALDEACYLRDWLLAEAQQQADDWL
ncbi:PH domain-containing protein [Gallaecimonas pentaromativorans]|uniref:Putative membrane protein YdbT with pleckstrin-like domain n=1 Tax=Gallaecimonas pentaromativorans TaxID=584787 RepID=A0A3N1PPL0_9GAMM|nr:PH domain-containing protein [Gallaecimonas pentaromativorans]ROQ30695.1 putative membrane protein YdbT with pleckstrin-like domain [Gallaecimonas pentaromativorans]